MSTTTIPTAIAVKLNLFEQLAALNVDVTVRESGAIDVQPRPLAKVAPVPAPVARPARTRAPRKAAVKPAKRPARKAKPAAPPVAAEPAKAPARAKKANVKSVPGNVQAVYDAVAAGADQAGGIRTAAKLAGGPFRHAMAMLKAGKIPGLRLYQEGEKNQARYGTSQEQAKQRYDAAMNPAPEPRKSLAVKPIKRVRREALDAALAVVE